MSSEPKNIMTMAELLRAAKIKREQEEHAANSGAIPPQTIVSDTISNPTIPTPTISPNESKPTISRKRAIPRPTIVPETIATKSIQKVAIPPGTIPTNTIPRDVTVDASRGYFQFLNDLSDRIIPAMRLTPFEQVVLTRLYRLSRGWQSEECTVGLGALSKQCVMSRTSVQKSVSVLVAKGLIDDLGEDKKGGKEGKRYRVLPGLTMPQRSIVNDTIPKDEKTMSSDTTEVQGTIPRDITNKDISKDIKYNTHTDAAGGVCVGSKFTLEECRRYAAHLKQTGQGINNPGGFAMTIYRSGSADSFIEKFLDPPQKSQPPDASGCPDCKGSGFYYPDGAGGGVVKCRHERLDVATSNAAPQPRRLTREEIGEHAGLIAELLAGGYTVEQAATQFAGGLHEDDWAEIRERAEI